MRYDAARCRASLEAIARRRETPIDELTQRHIDRCGWCQAENFEYRRLERALAAARLRPLPVDPVLLDAIVAALDSYDLDREHRAVLAGRAAACLGGLAAAGALVYAGKRRLGLAS